MSTLRTISTALALLVTTGSSLAQIETETDGASPRTRLGGMMRGFERSSPEIGARLPDISVHDAEGNPLRLRSFDGSYTVLVFGCLT